MKVRFDTSNYSNAKRGDLVEACRQAASEQFGSLGVNSFVPPARADGKILVPADVRTGTVIFIDRQFDLFGLPGVAVFHPLASFPEIAHEFGHLLGLQHSQGSSVPPVSDQKLVLPDTSPYFSGSKNWVQTEYGDRACVMSVQNVWLNRDGKGPTLCGPYLRQMGVIPDAKILSMPPGLVEWAQDLAPLRDPESLLPQLLRFRTPTNPELEYFIEFRVNDSWDAGIPNPGLMVCQTGIWTDGTWRAVRLYRDGTNPDDPTGFETALGQNEAPLPEGGIIEDPVRGIRIQATHIRTVLCDKRRNSGCHLCRRFPYRNVSGCGRDALLRYGVGSGRTRYRNGHRCGVARRCIDLRETVPIRE